MVINSRELGFSFEYDDVEDLLGDREREREDGMTYNLLKKDARSLL